ncbi:peptidyl-prolyl cis-trans isomerase E isoform X2 [Asparagus officinalis]|uniref:peptidyl-prolyl cis-trans isomerase E isoform X2 n=1 Tax=Asparagus officinalis TaxID=4686 RepID=UPI00098E5B7C|nr:peptidyl-prolyl cis-trans isomerase E isoform X2 [Asparagus officinalis]
MARNPACSVYIGNLDEKVSEKVLYEILVQVGRVVDLHIPRDKETNRMKGYAFAEYETEEIANYAMSGQDKFPQNNSTSLTPQANGPLTNNEPSPVPVQSQDKWPSVSTQSMGNYGDSSSNYPVSPVYPQVSPNGLGGLSSSNYEYSRRVLGAVLNDVSHPATRRPATYPSY